ncbi:hypothetical protein [Polymorphospora rubra]|uniref:hypothetical protein n=1 Tax=Polymorphospora rubra TaxID=338584 RepID=UPI0033C4204F
MEPTRRQVVPDEPIPRTPVSLPRRYVRNIPMMDRVTGDTEEGRKAMVGQEPIGRMGRPEEIASAVLWVELGSVPRQERRSPVGMIARKTGSRFL